MEALALVLLTVAVALAVLESAVPGLGLAGGGAVVASAGAAWLVYDAGTPWWPLLAMGAAAAVWALMVGWARPPAWAQVAAVGTYAAGGIGFGLLAEDPATIAVGLVAAVALAAAFPGLHGWTRRLVEQQPSTGMEALVGRTGTVETGAEGRPVVRLDGSLWSVAPIGPVPLGPGVPVVVRGWRGIVLSVEPVAPAPGVASAPS